MDLLLMIFLTALTSAAGYFVARRDRPLNAARLFRAFGALIDWIGLFVLFFTANLALGFLFILLIRGFTPRFVSLYELQNILLLVFSAVQAFLFHEWWKRG